MILYSNIVAIIGGTIIVIIFIVLWNILRSLGWRAIATAFAINLLISLLAAYIYLFVKNPFSSKLWLIVAFLSALRAVLWVFGLIRISRSLRSFYSYSEDTQTIEEIGRDN